VTAAHPDTVLLLRWADELTAVADAAGAAIMDVFRTDFAVGAKVDQSPVTAADIRAEDIVLSSLELFTPTFPIVAEERAARLGLPEFNGETFWLIDALDGTKEFVKRGDAFTVNIALIRDGHPVLGLVHAPARDEIFVGVQHAGARVRRKGAWLSIRARHLPPRVTVVGSRSHEVKDKFDAFLENYDVAETIAVGSSIKFCMVAEGKADLYPRFGPTNEWDTAAGDAVLRAAGGRVMTFDREPLRYKKPLFRNGGFLAEGLP